MFANRLDAGETMFLERDLQTKLRDSKDVKFRKLRLLKENLIPINTGHRHVIARQDAPDGTKRFTIRVPFKFKNRRHHAEIAVPQGIGLHTCVKAVELVIEQARLGNLKGPDDLERITGLLLARFSELAMERNETLARINGCSATIDGMPAAVCYTNGTVSAFPKGAAFGAAVEASPAIVVNVTCYSPDPVEWPDPLTAVVGGHTVAFRRNNAAQFDSILTHGRCRPAQARMSRTLPDPPDRYGRTQKGAPRPLGESSRRQIRPQHSAQRAYP